MELLRRFRFTVLLMILTTLVACGGGDGGLSREGGGDGGTTEEPVVISLALSTNDNVTGQEPVTVTATLTKDGTAVPNTTVVFELVTAESGIGALSPSSGTALTNDAGIAEITLTAGNVRGAGTIAASVASGEQSSIDFSTQGDDIGVVGDINITVILVDADGNPTDTITSSKSGKVIAEVNGISTPLIVNFVTTVGEIPITTAITDAENQASVDILAGGSLGAGSVTASIASGETGQVLLVVGSSTVTMGSGTPFVEGEAEISLAQISAGGTTVVTVNIIDDQGALFTEPVDVNFSSSCTSSNTSELSSPITTSNGIANSTYLAKGCVGDDPINVTANAGGINLSATTSVNVLPADVGSIEFVSSVPENISILGTGSLGGSESSVVKFRVLDTNSNPVNNQVVNFSLNTDVGGIQLIPDSATTNNEGIVQTVINSGTVATSVRVQATIDGSDPTISSQSSVLVVSTGIPDQDSFSLSASILNPEGWDLDGTTVEVTARLADAFNNPVPDGTAVSFTTEGGSIDPSCVTSNGVCTVTWRSQFPRPEGHELGDANNVLHPPEVHNTMGQKLGGRATVIATAIGEESFPDLNGNARFDASEVAAFLGTDISGDKYDLKEAFVDHNEDGFYNPDPVDDALAPADPNNASSGELEEFFDFNVDASFSQNDGKYNGVLCSIPAHDGCSSINKSLNVRRSLTLVMSGSSANVCTSSAYDNSGADVSFIRVDQGLVNSRLTLTLPVDSTEIMPTDDALVIARSNSLCHAEVLRVTYEHDDDDDPLTPDVSTTADVIKNSFDNALYIKGENSTSTTIIVSDLHNQPMPAGTKVKFTATAGSVVGPSSFTWPSENHNGGSAFGVTVKGEKEPKSGNLVVEITTPNELTTTYSNIAIIIQ